MQPVVDELLAAYRDTVQPQMTGLPMYNERLRTEAVGFEWRDGRLCGVLVTPWSMNLVLLPGDNDEWDELPPGKTIEVGFPSGNHRCLLSAAECITQHLCLPLFTTVEDFADQDTACRVAEETLRLLYLDPTEQQPATVTDDSQNPNRSGQTMSRRELLGF